MANEQNLIPMSERSKSEVREIGRKGGIASGEVRRAKAKEREEWQKLLMMAMKSGATDEIECLEDAKHANLSVNTAMKLKMITQALKGDVKAFNAVQRYAGLDDEVEAEEPVQEQSNGFVEALNKTAAEVWADEDEVPEEE